MKKTALLLAAVAVFQFAKAQDESFHKHALVISADWGGDVYALNEKYTLYTILGPVTQTQTGNAANSNFSFSAEFGLIRWLGLGLQFKIDNYVIKKDTSGYQPVAIGAEYGILVNFHIVRTHHIDFCAGLLFGGSNFTYTLDKYNDQVYGKGSMADIHVTLRYYFGRFGLNASLYFPTLNYPTLTGNNSNWSLGQSVLAEWIAKGGGINIGIQYRFLNPPGDK